MKNCLGECSLKVTSPNRECFKISASNPVSMIINFTLKLAVIFFYVTPLPERKF